MTILLTGGAGFIASNLLFALNKEGFNDVIIVDDLKSSSKWKNLVGKHFSHLMPKAQLMEWLVRTKPQLTAIFHLGACSSTTEPNADYLYQNNTQFSIDLVTYALERGIRFIYASSAATYGDGSQGFSDDHARLMTYRPLNMYGFSKHLFDLWLQRQGVLDQVVGLKYFNVFGPNEWHKGGMASALVKMVRDLVEQGKAFLFRSEDPQRLSHGEQQRDFIYVKDAVAMTLQFLHNRCGGLFNVGMGKPSSWNQLAAAACRALGKEIAIEYIPMPTALIGNYQDYTCAEMQKSWDHQLYRPQYTLDDGVRDYVQNYLISRTYL